MLKREVLIGESLHANLTSHPSVISRLMLPLVFLPRGIACELFLGVVELDLREHWILLGEVEDLREPGSLVEDLLVLRRVVVDVLGVINSMEIRRMVYL